MFNRPCFQKCGIPLLSNYRVGDPNIAQMLPTTEGIPRRLASACSQPDRARICPQMLRNTEELPREPAFARRCCQIPRNYRASQHLPADAAKYRGITERASVRRQISSKYRASSAFADKWRARSPVSQLAEQTAVCITRPGQNL